MPFFRLEGVGVAVGDAGMSVGLGVTTVMVLPPMVTVMPWGGVVAGVSVALSPQFQLMVGCAPACPLEGTAVGVAEGVGVGDGIGSKGRLLEPMVMLWVSVEISSGGI